ncbi:MAG: von Willebrand factor, type [Frankiales bacterium]|nr:von Willebrand factor, type [Frankiales bacterium]
MISGPRQSARHRRHTGLRGTVVIGAVLALAAAGVTVAGQAVHASTACDPHLSLLQVVASPDIAASVSRIADGLHDAAGCPQTHVRAGAEADVLTALRQPAARPPDVWVPDSSLWVERAVHELLVVPVGQESIASSPLVLAVPAALCEQLPPSEAPLQWQDAVNGLSTGQVVLHAAAEAVSPARVGILGALTAAVQQQSDARAALTGLLRAVHVDAGLADGTATLSVPGSSADGAVPVPEQAVFRHAGTPDATDVAAVYPSVAGTPFDYPYTSLRAGGHQDAIAGSLLAALRSTHGQQALREDGFRGVDGTGHGLTADHGVDGTQPGTVAMPDVAAAEDLLNTFDAVRRDARLLAVVDVSGSMAAPVAESGGSTRLDLALRAAAAGLELYPDTTKASLWSFSEGVSGTSDHQELVPIAPLTDSAPGGRGSLALAMARMRPVP